MSVACQLHGHRPRRVGEPRPFMYPVNPHNENPLAHGGIMVTEECEFCGYDRRVLINGSHREEGEWGPAEPEWEGRMV